MTSYLGAASFWLMTGRSATTLEKATVSIRPMKTPSLFFLRLPILAMKYLHKFRAMPLFRKSKRRCRLDHYLIAAPSNPVYRIVFLTKRSEEHTSELQSLMRSSYAVFCLKKKKHTTYIQYITNEIHKISESRTLSTITVCLY